MNQIELLKENMRAFEWDYTPLMVYYSECFGVSKML